VAEAWSVNRDDPVTLSKLIDQTTDNEVLGHGPIAVHEDHWPPSPAHDVVDLNPVDVNKPARGPTGLLGLRCLEGLAGLPNSLAALPDHRSGYLGG
jgi:hypothetical protein